MTSNSSRTQWRTCRTISSACSFALFQMNYLALSAILIPAVFANKEKADQVKEVYSNQERNLDQQPTDEKDGKQRWARNMMMMGMMGGYGGFGGGFGMMNPYMMGW